MKRKTNKEYAYLRELAQATVAFNYELRRQYLIRLEMNRAGLSKVFRGYISTDYLCNQACHIHDIKFVNLTKGLNIESKPL